LLTLFGVFGIDTLPDKVYLDDDLLGVEGVEMGLDTFIEALVVLRDPLVLVELWL
jgi:hypothetical protein